MGRLVLNKKQKIYLLSEAQGTAISDTAAPTVAEINVGSDIIGAQGSEELFAIGGFLLESNDIPMPGFADTTVPTFPGEQTYPSSSLTYYEDEADTTIKDSFVEGTAYYLLFARYGVAAAKPSRLYGCVVGSVEESQDLGDVAKFFVNLSITSRAVGTIA